MFTPRTTPVETGTQPYAWDVPSIYQCTWFCYFRSQEAMPTATPPCWWDRETQTGSYTNAKDWLANYRDPWEVKDPSYDPVAGDIAVFDGQYGHVQFLETDTMYSEYSSGDPNSFRNGKFEKKDNLLGFLHYPYSTVETVDRNVDINQIQTTDRTLRIRSRANLTGEILGHVEIGYYNVLNQTDADGYIWYEIAPDRWCADITTIYLPSETEDIIKQIEKYFNDMKVQVGNLKNENKKLEDKIEKIKEICDE